MAYTKQTWTSGEIITAEKLNHMEDGIKSAESAMFIITLQLGDNDYVVDKTMDEIMSAYDSGLIPVVNHYGNFYYPISTPDGEYLGFGGMIEFDEDHVTCAHTVLVDEGDGIYVEDVKTYNIPVSSEH